MFDNEYLESKIKKYLIHSTQLKKKNYRLYEISVRPKIEIYQGLSFSDKQQILSEMLGHLNIRIPELISKNLKHSKNYKLIQEWSVGEKQKDDGLIHTHSITGIHPRIAGQLHKIVDIGDSGEMYIKDEILKQKFPLIHSIELQEIYKLKKFIRYMFKNYSPGLDLDGAEPDSGAYCFELKGTRPTILTRKVLDKIDNPEKVTDRLCNRFIGHYKRLIRKSLNNNPQIRFT